MESSYVRFALCIVNIRMESKRYIDKHRSERKEKREKKLKIYFCSIICTKNVSLEDRQFFFERKFHKIFQGDTNMDEL